MKKILSIFSFVFALCVVHAQDPWAVNRLGATNSAAISTGYVFIDGRYVDAPYQVQQHGRGIFINGEFLNEAVRREFVFPPVDRPLVTVDPGVPTNFSPTSTFAEVWADAATIQKVCYWRDQSIRGTNLLIAATNFFASCGCFTQTVVTSTGPDTWDLDVYDRSGSATLVMLPFPAWTLPPRPPTPPDAELRTLASRQWQEFQDSLRSGRALWANGKGVTECGPPPSSNLVAILRMTDASAKLSQLAALGELGGVIGDTQNVEINLGRVLTAFSASSQLEQRVNGDSSWTNGIPSAIPQPAP